MVTLTDNFTSTWTWVEKEIFMRIGLVLGNSIEMLKQCEKRVKTKDHTCWQLIFEFSEVTETKLVEGTFLNHPNPK